MVPASVGHTSLFGVRPRSGHLQAIGCMRWISDVFFNYGRTCTRGRRCIPLSLGMSIPLMLLDCSTSSVVGVSCDFVSRLGGRDTNIFSKGYIFVAAVLRTSTWKPLQLSWRTVPASVGHTSFFGVRPRSGHLQAIGCTRWLLDGCFTSMAVA